ncbi:MAG: single-stranded DNA-binding protein [Lentisphaeria bacterium]|nr:single-stranded DNA-binding protein [Lentisphaeria bacterium]
MATLNKVFLLGNLARDPDLRGLNDGNSVCEMRMAVSRKYKMNGREVEETCFVDVIIFGKNACNCKQFLTKGSQIFAEGRLHLDTWETRDGDKRSKLVVIAENVQFMNNRRGVEQQYAPPANNEYHQEPEW